MEPIDFELAVLFCQTHLQENCNYLPIIGSDANSGCRLIVQLLANS